MKTLIPDLLLSTSVTLDMLLHVDIFFLGSTCLKYITLEKVKGWFLYVLSSGAERY